MVSGSQQRQRLRLVRFPHAHAAVEGLAELAGLPSADAVNAVGITVRFLATADPMLSAAPDEQLLGRRGDVASGSVRVSGVRLVRSLGALDFTVEEVSGWVLASYSHGMSQFLRVSVAASGNSIVAYGLDWTGMGAAAGIAGGAVPDAEDVKESGTGGEASRQDFQQRVTGRPDEGQSVDPVVTAGFDLGIWPARRFACRTGTGSCGGSRLRGWCSPRAGGIGACSARGLPPGGALLAMGYT